MCTTCDRLQLVRCPPALPVCAADFDEDLVDECDLESRLRQTSADASPLLDETTELVLRAQLTDPGGPHEAR